jgi:hypothetical protein
MTLGVASENVYFSPFTNGHIIRADERRVRATPENPTPVPNTPGDSYPTFPPAGVPKRNYTLPRPEPVSSQPPTPVIDQSSYGPPERFYGSLRYYGAGPY